MDQPLSKRELLLELGITDRLLKFWVNWYKLPVNRRGRGSNYPQETVQTLRIIKRLSDSRYFTMRFVRDLLSARGGDTSAMETHLELCRDILNGARLRSPSPAPRRPITLRPSGSEETPVRARPVLQPSLSASSGKRMGEDLL